jgi:hypothetical protein
LPIAIDWQDYVPAQPEHCDYESCDPPVYDWLGNEILCPYNCDPGWPEIPPGWFTNNGMPWYYPTNYRDILYLGTCDATGGCGGPGYGGSGGKGQNIPAPPPQTWVIPFKTPTDKLSIRLVRNVRATIFWSEAEDALPG